MKKLLTITFIGLTLLSCRKDELQNSDGPSLQDIYGPFTIINTLAASQNTVDFSAGQSVYFTCELSKTINWEMLIIGQTSGAEKIVNGTSKIIDASEFTWLGSTTNLPVFRAETCDVFLTFEGETDTLTTTVTIDQPKTNEGFVLANFETGWVLGWTSFIQSGASMDFNIKTDPSSPVGDSYYNMQGEVDWDWLVGLVNFNATAYGSPTLPLTSNPDNLYFNALIYGDSTYINSRILFQFEEDEDGDGSFNISNEDQFGYEIIIEWAGWKLVSIKYSDIEGNGNGGGIHNPDKINKVNMLHLADPLSGIAKSKLDYIIFTENEPVNL
jgi:hypothetical protein